MQPNLNFFLNSALNKKNEGTLDLSKGSWDGSYKYDKYQGMTMSL